jgi:hypothetical protein
MPYGSPILRGTFTADVTPFSGSGAMRVVGYAAAAWTASRGLRPWRAESGLRVLYSRRQRSAKAWALATVVNSSAFRNSSLNRLLYDSAKPFCHGAPGSIYAVVVLVLSAQRLRCVVPPGCSADKDVCGRHGPGITADPLTSRPMHTHPNARLTLLSRERLLRRHIDHGDPLAGLGAQAGISLRTAYKWLARYRQAVERHLRIEAAFAVPSGGC